uniref:Uncharacterized protein n=1 Tax=Panagrolaimus sp. ES5 TaxID=591445 RepID=A0AC34FMX5_9BILA
MSDSELIIERLKIDLRLLDPEWQNNGNLREEIEKVVNAVDDSHDTVSQLHERLANERSRIRVDSNSSSSSEGIQNTTRDVHGALSKLQKMLQPLVFHLKKLPHYLEGVSGIPESSEF